MSSYDGSRSARQSKRYSMSALYMSISANESDLVIEDELAKAQKVLRDLKSKISSQSKKNFVLEKDVRYLDSRIALLIANRMALEEVWLSDAPLPFYHRLTCPSKTKSRAILKTPPRCRRATSPTTTRHKNTAT